jgi:hypothetical protein
MTALPSLIYSGVTKTNAEVLVYANLGVGILKQQLGFGSSINITPCVSGEQCPVGSFDATVLNFPNKGAVGTIPAQAPVFAAAEGIQNPTIAGDVADVLCLPNPADDFLVCFDQGFQPTVGETYRAIPRKFNPVDHIVRQRGTFSLTLTDYYVSNWDGIERLRGRRCTIVVKITPGGGGSIQEIQYYTNVTLNVPPISTGNDANASVEIQGTGNFSYCAIFSAPKP